MCRSLASTVVALLAPLVSTALAVAADADLERLLQRPILEAKQSQQETLDYCRPRIARLTQPTQREAWQQTAQQLRQRVLDEVVLRGAAQQWSSAPLNVEWLEDMEGGPEYQIRKLRYEAVPGLWIPALLYQPRELSGKVPVILNVNGHDGNGKAAVYKQMRCINLAKRGLIALNVEWLGMGQLRGENYSHTRMNQLDLCGTSGLAPFFLSMQRGLDLLLQHPHADPQRVAVAGLSGGGWQTIIISSLDPRVTLANPVAGYSSFLTRLDNFSDLGDSEQTPVDLGALADYTHLTALLAPRGALLTYNVKDDCCFASDHALPPLLAAARPVYELYGAADRLLSHVNHDPGTHNFELDNRLALYRAIHAMFYGNGPEFASDELPCEAEVKSAEQLQVALPDDNADFHRLAMAQLADLPHQPALPASREALDAWAAKRRIALREVLRIEEFPAVQSEAAASDRWHEAEVTYWKLKVGEHWTVPAVEICPAEPQGTTLVVADTGRLAARSQLEELVKAGRRVIAVDPFYHGESRMMEREYLFALLVSTVGKRPLGLQVQQLVSVARWAEGAQDWGTIDVQAVGPRSSLIALTATAVDAQAIASVKLYGSLGSLKEIVEQNLALTDAPEYFCFGLLAEVDVPQLVALCVPRPVTLLEPSQRARQELAGLRTLYGTAGKEFSPVE